MYVRQKSSEISPECDSLSTVLKLTPDVAGATFMAAGSSAPELATVIIAVFFAKDDIGVSGVIGETNYFPLYIYSVPQFLGEIHSYADVLTTWWIPSEFLLSLIAVNIHILQVRQCSTLCS